MIKPGAKVTDIISALDKKDKGAVSAEYQILENNTLMHDSLMDILPITSVHTALMNEKDVEFDLCFQKEDPEESSYNIEKLTEGLKLAEYCGSYENRRVPVVVHMKNNVFPCSDDEVINCLVEMFEKYPHTELAIENTMLVSKDGVIRTASLCGSVPNIVRRLKNKLDEKYKNRIGTVFDICHALGTIRMLNRIYQILPMSCVDEKAALEKYFKENADVCKILHFANASGYAINQSDHGVVFHNNERELMLFLIDCYEKYIPNASFVIEVREEDYSDAKNFEKIILELIGMERYNEKYEEIM